MPFSFQFGKVEAVKWIRQRNPSRILDVGAGSGIYGKLLDRFKVDAIEVYEPYIEKFSLAELYDNVIPCDAREFSSWANYELVILGDVIQQMNENDAAEMVNQIQSDCLMAVPYRYKQPAGGPNPFEAHVQDDLTSEIVRQRYPDFTLLAENTKSGYWTKFRRLRS